MDAQVKRGLMEACVMAQLARGDSYGYQIVRALEPVFQISESTLYPILKRLETANCLGTYSVEHNGRLRRYYRLLDAGRGRVAEFIREWSDVERMIAYIKESSLEPKLDTAGGYEHV